MNFEAVLHSDNKYDLYKIVSQSTQEDKRYFLDILKVVRNQKDGYGYLEIGSYLGGSITPYLLDPKCAAVLSVDDRGKAQQDERGIIYNYDAITTQMMLDGFDRAGVDHSKLKTFDGPMSAYSEGGKYDVALIDGIHTDDAIVEDFLYVADHMNEDCIVLFHDFALVYKGFEIIRKILQHRKVKFGFGFRPGSNVCLFGIGRFSGLLETLSEATIDQLEAQYNLYEEIRVMSKFKHRARIKDWRGDRPFNVPQNVYIAAESLMPGYNSDHL